MKKILAAAGLACLIVGSPIQAVEGGPRSVVERAKAAAQANRLQPRTTTGAVGVVEYSRGATTLQGASQGASIVSRGAKFNRNDIITTGKKSFAILRLTDGTRLTLRPNSKFAVEEFNPSLTKDASAKLSLFRGGMRAITGFISKYNSNGYKMRTPVATIGIRGTEFEARLCGTDCAEESKSLKKVDLAKPRAVGRVAFMRGHMAARNVDGNERKVRRGEPIYEGDTLVSGKNSFGVIAFRDKSRVTMQPRSQFLVEKFKFNVEKPRENVALMSLLRGGLRAVSGRIGKLNRNAYKMRTPVATIGIRGTGYDLQCQGSCISLDDAAYFPGEPTLIDRVLDLVSSPAYAEVPASDGMFAHVWDGGIDVDQGGNVQQLNNGEYGFVANVGSPLQVLDLSQVPSSFINNTAPKPDQVEIDEDAMFSELDSESVSPGLYVSVHEGIVTMEGENGNLDIGAGEGGGYPEGGVPKLLPTDFPQLPEIPDPSIGTIPDTGGIDGTCYIS